MKSISILISNSKYTLVPRVHALKPVASEVVERGANDQIFDARDQTIGTEGSTRLYIGERRRAKTTRNERSDERVITMCDIEER